MAMGGPRSGGGGDEEAELFVDINITPLTDIFLVLLIIFMVTSSIVASDAATRAGMKVNLPRGAAKEVAQSGTNLTIAVLTDGKLIMDGKEIAVDTLKARFEDAAKKDPNTQIIVQAEEATHHGRVVAVMELAKAAGLRRLVIATRGGK
jgi:biopolymer transport protein ExbD